MKMFIKNNPHLELAMQISSNDKLVRRYGVQDLK